MNNGSTTGDSLKDSIMSGFQFSGDTISLQSTLITMGMALAIGLFIYIIYKKTFSGVVYVKSFGVSLVLLCMISSIVLLAVASNAMLALGMVGALSIVRFRTAVKDPMDTVFMFWAIGEGIVLGAGANKDVVSGMYLVAIISSVIIGAAAVFLKMLNLKKTMPYIMVLRFEDAAKADVQNLLRKFPQGKLKSKTVGRGIVELTIEISVNDSEIALMEKFAGIPGVLDASIISYTGDVV